MTDAINTKESREAYASAIHEVWDREDMRKYCIGKAAVTAILPNGIVFEIEKRKVETDFCFGYSLSRYDSEDYDRANAAARNALTDEEYFIRENMEGYTRFIKQLDEATDPESCKPLYILMSRSYDKGDTLFHPDVVYWNDVERAFQNGMNDYRKHTGEKIQGKYNLLYVPTAEDIEIIKAAYRLAADQHEKKVRAYLKRYGLSKVRSWAYWQDE